MKFFGLMCLVMMLLTAGCDNERFLNYNYRAQKLIKTARISGTIRHFYTGSPVDSALVTIEKQSVLTDARGNYEFLYPLSPDAELGRAVPIRITAENYLALDTSQVFFPEAIELNFVLVYAAPVVEEAVIVNQETCQALVSDYQGGDDIESVVIRLHYKDPQSGAVVRLVDLTMLYMGENAPYTYRYQAAVPMNYPLTDKGDFIIVTARDRSGNVDQLLHSSDPKSPDNYLFPPDTY